MGYVFCATIHDNFDNAIQKLTRELKAEGFGILTDIDINASRPPKPGSGGYPYRILGACNSAPGLQTCQEGTKVKAMLSCNVIVKEKIPGEVEVSAVDPAASMMAVSNKKIGVIAREIRERLQRAISNLS